MNKYQQIDVWWCGSCDITYLVPSVPHQPWCPKCGTAGWWKRFADSKDIQRNNIWMGSGALNAMIAEKSQEIAEELEKEKERQRSRMRDI